MRKLSIILKIIEGRIPRTFLPVTSANIWNRPASLEQIVQAFFPLGPCWGHSLQIVGQ
jgi:hypothetical protein